MLGLGPTGSRSTVYTYTVGTVGKSDVRSLISYNIGGPTHT